MLLSGKKYPLEPLSMKLPESDVLLKSVVKLSFESKVNTVALPRALFDSVPIPKIMEPFSVASELVTVWKFRITPLLSVVNRVTGFVTCWLAAESEHSGPHETKVGWQLPELEHA